MAIFKKKDTELQVLNSMFRKSFIIMLLIALSTTIGNVTDGIIIGRFLGSTAISSYGLASPYFSLMTALGALFAIGLQVVCAENLAKGEKTKASQIFNTNFLFAIILALLITVVGMVFAKPLSVFLSANKSIECTNYLRLYLLGLFPGTIAFIGTMLLAPIMQLDADAKRSGNAVIILTIVNIVLDIVSVAVFHQGMFAMGLATSLANWCAFIYLLLHFKKPDVAFVGSLQKIDVAFLKIVISCGYTKALRYILNVVCKIALNHWVLFIGATQLMASISVQDTIQDIASVIVTGIQDTVVLLAGVYYGESDDGSLHKLVRVILRYVNIIVIPCAILGAIFASYLAQLIVHDSQYVVQMATIAIRCFFICLPFATLNGAYIAYYQGVQKNHIASKIVIIERFVLPLGLAFILGYFFGPLGLILSFGLKDLVLSIFIAIFALYKKQKSKAEDNILVENTQKIFSASISKMEEVPAIVDELLLSHELDKKKTYYVALCVEEMVGNIMNYGFVDNRPHNIDIRIVYNEDKALLRFRDNCRLFDFSAQTKIIWDEENEMDNLGTKVVMGISKEIKYMNLLDTNVLTIII